MKKIILFFFVFLFLFLSACSSERPINVNFVINGGDEEIEVNSNYFDKGAKAYSENDDELVVLVSNNVNTSKIGDYQVIYTVNYKGQVFNSVRNVNVYPPKLSLLEKRLAQAAIAIKENAIIPSSVVFNNIMYDINAITGTAVTQPRNDLGIPVPYFLFYTSNSTQPYLVAIYFPGDYRYDNPSLDYYFSSEYDLYFEVMRSSYINSVTSALFRLDAIFYYASNNLKPE
jgi:hypothetical protein